MKSKTKEKILKTASYLFHKQGYNSTGINQIIEEADIAKATLYQHYKSKEELAIAYLTSRHTDWMKQLNEFIKKGKNTKEKLLLSFDFIVYMNEKENYQGCCFLNMLTEIQPENKNIYNVIINHKKNLISFFSSLLANKSPEFQKHIYLLFESALIETQLYRDSWPVNTAKEYILHNNN